jgi:two-component system sensor histidine kinase KdpD
LVSYRIGLSFTVTAFVYLIAIVLNCIDSSFAAAALVSLLAAAALDFYFTAPLFTFRVISGADVAALLSFILTSLVITRLSSRARDEARGARRERRNIERLYQVAQRILTLPPAGTIDKNFLVPFRLVFGLRSVCLFDPDSAAVYTVGESRARLEERTQQAYILRKDDDDPISATSCRSLRVAGKVVGVIGFEGLEDGAVIAGPLAALAAAGIERISAFRNATSAAAQTEADSLRTAILDALAHEFKTPLSTILTAVDGLREAGPLRPSQAELAEIVDSEASRLASLTSRLLRMARLDQDEIKPRLEPLDCGAFASGLIERYASLWPGHRFSMVNRAEHSEVLGDEELLRLALSQLLDNACKYSPAGSEIRIGLESISGEFAFTVWNDGPPIPPAEQRRIFERFYRGSQTRFRAPGTGLGLYVARKIALAHGGDVGLDAADSKASGHVFRLTIPVVKGDDAIATAQLQGPGRG